MAGTNYPDFYEAITNTSTLTLDTLILNNKVITAIENIPMGNANNDILIWDFTNQQWIPSATYFGRGHLIDGTEIAPALAFNSNTNTGIYKVGNNIIGFSCNGVQQMRLTTTEAVFNQNIEVNNILSTLARGIVISQKSSTNNNILLGWNTGQNLNGTGNVCIGENAGRNSSAVTCNHIIAIGHSAHRDVNATSAGSIGIGYGVTARGSNNIIIGTNGHSNSTENSIMLNASSFQTFSPSNSSFVVRPIRNVAQTTGILQYNTSNFEVTYHRDVDVQNITASGVLTVPLGSVGTPSITFNGDSNTGIYSSASDTLNISTNGVSRLQVSNIGTTINDIILTSGFGDGTSVNPVMAYIQPSTRYISSWRYLDLPITTATRNLINTKADSASPVFTGQSLFPLGSVTIPSISFSGDSNTGIYSSASDTLNISTNGVSRLQVSNIGTTINDIILTSGFGDGTSVNPVMAYIQPSTRYISSWRYLDLPITTATRNLINTKADSASPVFTGQSLFPLGSVTIPSISFSGDNDTGIFSSGADVINISTGGISRMQITNTGTTINNLTTTGVTSSGNISIISPSGNSEILIQTQNNLTSKLSLKEFSTSYGMELIYNGTDNAFYIDALNVTRTTIFSTSVATNISTFFRPVYFENNIFFPNTSTISIAGLSQPTNSVINPQFTFLHPITKINQRTGLSYNDVAGASPSLVLVADGSAILQAGVDTGVTSLLQIRGTKHATIPTYSFRDDTNTGITSDSADSLKIMCGGITTANFDTGDINLISNDINLQTSYLSFGTTGQLFLTYNTVPGSGYDALNFYCQSKLRFQIVDNTSNIQECRFLGVTAQGASYLSIIYWSDAHIYYRNSRNVNDPTPKRHYFQAYDYQGLKGSYITPGTTSWQTFTGQHICTFEMEKINVGYIVVSTGKISSFIDNKDGHLETKTGKDGVIIDEALPIVTYSSKMNQKSVFGVVCSIEEENAETRDMGFDVMTSYSKDKNDRRVIINSIGEGAIWVCNSNGNLENGDYITSSIIRGLGCRQHDDVLHNYTVSKITIDCSFDDSNAYEIKYIDINDIEMTKEEYEIKKQTETVYIKAFLPCTYHCG